MSTFPEGHPNYVDMDAINRAKMRFSGSQNRFCRPDRLFPLPPVGRLDRFSRCFVTQQSHITKRDQSYCVACDHWMTET